MFRVLFVVTAIMIASINYADSETNTTSIREQRQFYDHKYFSNCGRIFNPDTNNNGKNKYGSTPWNVGIYRKESPNKYVMICGGTLISRNLVVTVAQFFWQKGLKDKIIRDTSKYYKTAVGKYTRDISVVDNDSTQIIDVKLIYLEDNYRDSAGYYANDIAIIVLKNNVIMSDAVIPVCIDWTKKYTIPNGSAGKIVGWGMTDNMEPSPILLELFLPYFNRSTCKNLNLGDQPYITNDKFCGFGGESFRGGEAGFGGAGLTFAKNDLHVLSGILSIKYKGRYQLLTDVSQHIPWIQTIFLKNTDTNCGRLFTPKRDSNDLEGKYGSTPWNAGIYRKINQTQEYVMICGGTLIASNLVATAAQFFWQKGLKDNVVLDNIQYYKIAVGKYTRDISEIDNKFTQIVDVKFIYLENNYQDSTGYYANDIAIVVLKNNVMISDAVMPICIDWTKKYTIPNGSIGKIVGWGLTDNSEPSRVLLEFALPYTDRIACQKLNKTNTVLQKYVTSDKFCGIKGQEFRGGEAGFGGAGLTFAHQDGLHVLVGIMSITFRRTIEILTDVSKHISWIHNIYSRYNVIGIELNVDENNNDKKIEQVVNPGSVPSSVPTTLTTKVTCTIPFIDGSTYSINGNTNQNTVLLPGTKVPLNSKVEETCVTGYHKVEIYKKKHIICDENGEWFPPLNESEPLCLKKCPPMKSDSLDLTCSYNGREVDCTDPAISGTTLEPKCKATHSLPDGQFETPIVSICFANGTWSQQLYSCLLNCGKRTAIQSITPLISNGVESKFGSVPWNVGVYVKKNNNYELECGGTLISKNLIISAATCFSTNVSNHYMPVNDDSYLVAVAKYTRDISIKDNPFTQIIKVKEIYLEDNYFGTPGRYANDLAIIVLTNDVSMSHFVLPVCIDWTAKNPAPVKSIGTIVGWGQTETGEVSQNLMEAALPYIERTKCLKLYNIINIEFKAYLTLDKFCAGSQSGQGVNRGDTGFGLTFEYGGLYYLTGISSIKDRVENSYSVFTNVDYHLKWIKSIRDNYNKQRVPMPRK